MSDPVRLLHKSGGLAAALLRAGAEERPSNARLRRAMSAVGATAVVGSIAADATGGAGVAGLVGSSAAGSAATAGASAPLSLLIAAKWIAIGGISGLVTVGATSQLAPQRPPRAAEPTTAHASERARAPASTDRRSVGSEITAPLVQPSDPLPENALPPPAAAAQVMAVPAVLPSIAGTSTPAPKAERASSPTTSPTEPARAESHVPAMAESTSPASRAAPAAAESSLRLAREVGLVDAAWSDMKEQRYARVVDALANYEAAFPELGLHPEVLFLRMEAEGRLGRTASAKAHALRIVGSYPKSAQALRARALLERP